MRHKLFYLIFMCAVAVVPILVMIFLKSSSFTLSELIVKEHTFASTDAMEEVPLEGERVVGVFEALNIDEQGAYLLSAFVGDPPPEVRTFEAIGTPVLFRYNISTEETTRVAEMEN